MQHQAASTSVQFSESPMSPLRRVRTRISQSPLHKPEKAVRKCEFVGSLKAVNEHLSREGLLRQPQIQPLISEVALDPKTPEDVVGRRRRKLGKERVTNEDIAEDAALIERYSYPGYMADKVTYLPHHLDAAQLMEKVTQIQKGLKTKHSFQRYWRELFSSVPSHDIFLDMFWWFFLNQYQPQKDKQHLLFDRIARNYVKLLTKVSQKYKDSFFKMYPDVLAQCVYSAFIRAFPTSWTSFDEQFKTTLCNLIYQWFLGIKPLPNSWKCWNIEELEPKNLMKHTCISSKTSNNNNNKSPTKKFDLEGLVLQAKCQEQKTRETDSLKTNTIPTIVISSEDTDNDIIIATDDTLLKVDKSKPKVSISRERGSPEKREEPLMLGGPEFEHVVMDTSSHSPLVQYFLSTHGLIYQTGRCVLLQHADMTRLPDPNGMTYQQVLKQSATKSQHTQKTFERSYKSLKDHMYKCERERAIEARRHNRELSSLMRNPKEVRALSNFLTVNQLCDQMEKKRKEKAHLVMNNALKRVL